jgi:DHA1 family multidrug resistance protein-like MFS transporter
MVVVQAAMQAQNQLASPFFPQFLEQNGVHPLSSVEYWSGAIQASGPLFGALFAPYWGGVGDRIGRKRMVLRSSLASSLAFIITGFCTNPGEMFVTRLVSGIFSGFSTSAMALVASQVPGNRLGYSLGWLSTGQIAGALIGPLLGGIVADHVASLREVFIFAGGGTMVLALGCVAFVREEFQAPEVRERAGVSLRQSFREIALHPSLAPMFVLIALAQVCSSGISPVLPIFIRSIVGNTPHVATITGAALALTGVAGLLSTPFLGRRSDEIGHRRVLLISLTGTALTTLPQMLTHNIIEFVSLRFGLGLFLGGILPSANAIIGKVARPETRGQTYGFTSTAQFFGRFAGPLLGSSVAALFGIRAVFALIGLLMLLNLVWVWTRVQQPASSA